MIETIKREILENRIEHGVRWLDGWFGRDGWLPVIEEERLDLAKGNTCMIGQLFPRHSSALRNNFTEVISSGVLSVKDARKRGFYLESSNFWPWIPDTEDYDLLTVMWLEKLAALKNPPMPTVSPIQQADLEKVKTRGFALIELLVVIAIIGILSAVILASLHTAACKKDPTREGCDNAKIEHSSGVVQ